MNFWEFYDKNPILMVLLSLLFLSNIHVPLNFIFRLWNRYLRSKNIRSQGWPPPHLDADGDFKPDPKVEDT